LARALTTYPLAILLTISLLAITMITINSIAKISMLSSLNRGGDNRFEITYVVYNNSLYIIPIKKYYGTINAILIDYNYSVNIYPLHRRAIDDKVVYGPIPLGYKYIILISGEGAVVDVLKNIGRQYMNTSFTVPQPPILYIDPTLSRIDLVEAGEGLSEYYELVPRVRDKVVEILYPNTTYTIDNQTYRPIHTSYTLPLEVNRTTHRLVNGSYIFNVSKRISYGLDYYGGYLIKIILESGLPIETLDGLDENYSYHVGVYPRNTDVIRVVEKHVIFNGGIDNHVVTDLLVNITHEIVNASLRGLWSDRIYFAKYNITYNLTLSNNTHHKTYIYNTVLPGLNVTGQEMVIDTVFNEANRFSINSSIYITLTIEYNIEFVEVVREPLILKLYSHIWGNLYNHSILVIKHNTLHIDTGDNDLYIVLDNSNSIVNIYQYLLGEQTRYEVTINSTLAVNGSTHDLLLDLRGTVNASVYEYALPDIVFNTSCVIVGEVFSNATRYGVLQGIIWFNSIDKPLNISYRIPPIILVGNRSLAINTHTLLLLTREKGVVHLYNGSLHILSGGTVKVLQNIDTIHHVAYYEPILYTSTPIDLVVKVKYLDGVIDTLYLPSGLSIHSLRNMFIEEIDFIVSNNQSKIYLSMNTGYILVDKEGHIDYTFIDKPLGYVNLFGERIIVYETMESSYRVALILSPNSPLIKNP